jgi:hypothetical protein
MKFDGFGQVWFAEIQQNSTDSAGSEFAIQTDFRRIRLEISKIRPQNLDSAGSGFFNSGPQISIESTENI